ncbi:hypothetical protein CLS_37080 [[Clostridium] cf. saccharolyticum K10]|nr:hypothetical protein CLS_37080 [[Clostridium] cf. saccharolyticum K10]
MIKGRARNQTGAALFLMLEIPVQNRQGDLAGCI